jgi:acyl-CoA synthetase (AMP-forming)/AMP-acid ligase II
MSRRPSGDDELIPARLARISQSLPDALAFECEGSTMTWRELFEAACRIDNGLAADGCQAGTRVALLAGNSVHHLGCLLGVTIGGRCAVSLPTNLGPDATATLLADCEPDVLVCDHELRGLPEAALERNARRPRRLVLNGGDAPGWTSLADWLRAASADYRRTAVRDDDEFNIVYSSGTTGVPKGIVHSHRTRAMMARGFQSLGFDADTRTLLATPLYTNLSLPAFLATLWGGGCTIVMPKFDALGYLELAARSRATHFFLVPVQAQRLLASPTFAATDLSATRLKYVAGSHLDVELKRRMATEWPGPLVEVYGMSEGAPVTSFVVNDYPDKISSVGRPPPGTQIRIIDDTGHELGLTETGEIVGRSSTMMLGYNGSPAQTQELLWHDREGTVFFRSGDIGRLDKDGFLYVVDRKKDMIISGGLNVFAVDLEEVLARHPAVLEVAVVAAPSARWGETPAAFVVPRLGAAPSATDLRQWANERLGKYQRLGHVVLRSALPRNALGKVLKRNLREECGELCDAVTADVVERCN